ncbi:MAG: hypothetical protein II119_04330 [Bacilli bacterium]|nr:hypothetical protein [Bacilli bacterium]
MKKINRRDKMVILVVLIVLLSIGAVTMSKYIIEEFHSYYLNAKHFYFTSNRLKKDNPVYLVNNWSGVESFDISFDLLSEKNSLVYSDYDIPYQVTYVCPNDVTCTLDKPTGTIYESSLTHSDRVTLSITPNRNYTENERLVISIKAKSTAPYKEELNAQFEYVVGKQGITYEIEDEANRPYLLLKVTNAISHCTVTEAFGNRQIGDLIDINVYKTLSEADKAKCKGEDISISFNPNVTIIDTTDNILDKYTYQTTTISGIDYVSSLDFVVDPVSTAVIKFYKINPTIDYTYPITNSTSIITVSF